jgi:hypothetical protein
MRRIAADSVFPSLSGGFTARRLLWMRHPVAKKHGDLFAMLNATVMPGGLIRDSGKKSWKKELDMLCKIWSKGSARPKWNCMSYCHSRLCINTEEPTRGLSHVNFRFNAGKPPGFNM